MSPRRRIWSLRRRLLAWLLIATAVMGVLALIDTWVEAERTADALADRVLAGSALVIAERAALDAEGRLEIAIPYGALEMLSSAAQDRVFYRVDSPPGTLITGYPDLAVVPTASPGVPVFADGLYQGAPVRLATLTGSVSTGIDEVPFTVTMAETTLAREALSRDILLRSAIRLSGMIFGAAAIVWIAVTLSLRPLRRLGEAIAARSPSDLSPVETAVPSEVRNLVAAVNALMLRLSGTIEGLRNFTGNAGHQLRTPMAVMRTRLALAARATDLETAHAAVAESDAALSRAERVLAQLLALARVDAAGAAGVGAEVMDLVPVLRDLTADHIPAAADAGVDLGFEPTAAPLLARVEPLLLGEALHNLLSNAILHAGRGAEVTLRLIDSAHGPVIAVEDNGPGIPEAARRAMLTRFTRANLGAQGLGLGLPVVEEIARLFGGALALEEGPGGRGLSARITLPQP